MTASASPDLYGARSGNVFAWPLSPGSVASLRIATERIGTGRRTLLAIVEDPRPYWQRRARRLRARFGRRRFDAAVADDRRVQAALDARRSRR